MVQYRALVIVVLLLLSTTVPEVHSKSISDRGRRDWLVTLDAAAAYIYESVYKLSPKAAQFLLDASRSAYISSIRSFLIRETARMTVMMEELIEKIKSVLQINGPDY